MSQTLKFLESKINGKKAVNDKSCYYKKDGIMIMINCGLGVLDAVKTSGVLKNVKQVYQILTHDSPDHIHDLKEFFAFAKGETGNTPILIDSISFDKDILKKRGIKPDIDCQILDPIKSGFNWINFLAVPHKDKSMSCPVELFLNNKKILYAGECNNIPFNIQGYNEYYFDFADKESEYFLGPDGIKRLAKKNKIRKNRLWLVHFISERALRMAQHAEMQVAKEELHKFDKVSLKTKNLTKKPQAKTNISKTKKETTQQSLQQNKDLNK